MFTSKSVLPAAGVIGLILIVLILALPAPVLSAGPPTRDVFDPAATRDAFTSSKKNLKRVTTEVDRGKYSIVVDSDTIYNSLTTGKGIIDLQIKFSSGSSKLSPDARMQLQQISTALKKRGLIKRKIMIIGHTDNVGAAAANQKLSEKRALQVKKALIESGIEKNRLKSSGRGESEPVTENNSAAGRARNRRVTLAVINKQ